MKEEKVIGHLAKIDNPNFVKRMKKMSIKFLKENDIKDTNIRMFKKNNILELTPEIFSYSDLFDFLFNKNYLDSINVFDILDKMQDNIKWITYKIPLCTYQAQKHLHALIGLMFKINHMRRVVYTEWLKFNYGKKNELSKSFQLLQYIIYKSDAINFGSVIDMEGKSEEQIQKEVNQVSHYILYRMIDFS